jgi:hypothetical protein
MKNRAWMLILILASVAGFSGSAGADLSIIGTAMYAGDEYRLIYETDRNLIWLDYTNRSNRWPQQMAWAAGLNEPEVLIYHLNPGVKVSWNGNWRLPDTMDGPRRYGYDGTTTAGFNITSSEMGHLFYASLRNPGYYDTNGNPLESYGLLNTGPFTNLQDNIYWSDTVYATDPDHAWDFNMYFGAQNNMAFKSSYSYSGLAVRPGRVTVE